MLEKIHIQNFKSILDYTLELGRINVLIGENGAGKTNILEAFATASAASDGSLEIEELYTRGVRIAKPSITISSFLQKKSAQAIALTLTSAPKAPNNDEEAPWLKLTLHPDASNIDSGWQVDTASAKGPISNLSNKQAFIGELLSNLRDMRRTHSDASMLQFLDNAVNHRSNLSLQQQQLKSFCIYNLNPLALRGIQNTSRRLPLGINGENLDVFLEELTQAQRRELVRYSKFIPWFDNLLIDTQDELKFKGHKLGRSTSRLYFRDRFMKKGNNVFSAENANEGILHILFYLALFLSDKTPSIFAIDNIETALNPQLCRELMKSLAAMAKAHDKQVLITTHNPAILDGLDLHDDDQRLVVIRRNDQGHTEGKRIKLKPKTKDESQYKLSELWMRGHLGGIPNAF
ncbi:AAA family ATPase [Archangium primigenium]|uniref:AAA family ATPase n=1 Tax=[Archangium] primigenium TaxID=2792470 RepID=UPI001955FF45|nr:AAA family ATPase [Archangium primigenium]MBM7113662.1 AAA family ATPase [Archangium primigenium]